MAKAWKLCSPFDPESFEAEGTSLTEALETINGYCASYAQQQMQGQGQGQMPQQQMPEGLPEEDAPAPEDEATAPEEDAE